MMQTRARYAEHLEKRTRSVRRVADVAFVLLPVLAAPAWGQDTLRLKRLAGHVVLDGRVDEPAWDSIPILPLTMYTPQYRGELTEQTEIRVAYDDEFLYVSGRMYDSHPNSARANTLYRDAYAGDDLTCIALDTYNDHQTASWFCVNPAGGRIDQELSNDGESPTNIDWNTFWAAEASQARC